MARNYIEAIREVAKAQDLSIGYVINNGYVIEHKAEEDKSVSTTWYDENDKELKAGTPIGYLVDNGVVKSEIIAYEGIRKIVNNF